MHSAVYSAEKETRSVTIVPERFLLTASLALMALAAFLANFDDPLLHAIYRLTHAGNAGIWRSVSLLGSGVMLTPLVAAIALVLIWRNQSMNAMALAFGWAATSLTIEYLKWLLDRGRPSVTPWAFARGNAFPSGHAAQALYVSLSLGWAFFTLAAPAWGKLLRKTLAAILLAVPLMVGYSRLALGVHWPSDIAAGWAVGVFFLAFAQALQTPYLRRRYPPRGLD
jgi:undecaprenyl-diphosphatase